MKITCFLSLTSWATVEVSLIDAFIIVNYSDLLNPMVCCCSVAGNWKKRIPVNDLLCFVAERNDASGLLIAVLWSTLIGYHKWFVVLKRLELQVSSHYVAQCVTYRMRFLHNRSHDKIMTILFSFRSLRQRKENKFLLFSLESDRLTFHKSSVHVLLTKKHCDP